MGFTLSIRSKHQVTSHCVLISCSGALIGCLLLSCVQAITLGIVGIPFDCVLGPVVLGIVYWVRDNAASDYPLYPSTMLLYSVVLVTISEVALFGSLLLSVLYTFSGCAFTGSLGCMYQCTVLLDVEWGITLYQNTLTLLNTDLLLTSGVWGVAAMHAVVLHLLLVHCYATTTIILLAVVFLAVQCCEYLHLYWCIYSSGVAGVFYTTTGVHGGHVVVGMMLILLYTMQVHTWGTWGGYSLSTTHGLLGILLYWHFVDAVWISVVYIVYSGQLCM
nr:cytochrome c oxidase subunit 3 [Rhynchopus humris]